jgi:exodeoxyribonuclease VII large subunit
MQLQTSSARLAGSCNLLAMHSPNRQLQRYRSRVQSLDQQLKSRIATHQLSAKSKFEVLIRALNSVSPLAVLDRGYALIKKENQLIMNAGSVTPGDEVTARLANGEILAEVKATRPVN